MRILREDCRVTVYNKSKACEGYTLIDPFTSNDVWLIDMEGNYVHRWIMPATPRNHGVLLPSGNLLYAMAKRREEDSPDLPKQWGLGAGLIEVDWGGNLTWKYVDVRQHHSYHRMRNGNTLYCIFMRTPNEIAKCVKGGIRGSEDRGMMFADGVAEVNPDGEVVWEWKACEHLDPEKNAICDLCPRDDWTHLNSCCEMPNGDVLLSFRNISTICIVDRSTGNIKWQWGPGDISHQHDASVLDNGNILVFDNGSHRNNDWRLNYSRIVEVDPKTSKVQWEYIAEPPQSFYSGLISGCTRLANGNTLICEGTKGRVFEVTMDGEMVWEYTSPFFAPHPIAASLAYGYATGKQQVTVPHFRYSNMLFRAYRYSPNYPGFKDKDLNPAKVAQVNKIYGPEAFKD